MKLNLLPLVLDRERKDLVFFNTNASLAIVTLKGLVHDNAHV